MIGTSITSETWTQMNGNRLLIVEKTIVRTYSRNYTTYNCCSDYYLNASFVTAKLVFAARYIGRYLSIDVGRQNFR